MGASGSSPADCNIDDSPIQTTEEWTLHHAQNPDQGPLSVFVDNKFKPESALHALARSLKLFRHPSILKYVYWSEGSGRACLYTEKVSPLSLVRGQQSRHAVGLGLLELCQALQFLHDKGNVIHGNLSQSAVFVTPEGRWKLGGLEKTQKMPLAPNPAQNKQTETSRDVLALGVLMMEVLGGFDDKDSISFLEYSNSNLLLPDLTRRPTIAQVLDHSYFQQPYIHIYSFLKNITLKTEDQKALFFSSLVEDLRYIPEGFLGQRFTELLLSRYVLMDATARIKLIPKVLQPKSKNSMALFSDECFNEYVVPQLRKMFLVYDTGVRLILLEHFGTYSSSIDAETLEDDILPALLLGLRDSNPVIVAQTLRALAELVPILGPETVVGKNRSKVFSDGSPNRKTERVVPDLSISNVLDVRSEVENCQQGKQISSPCSDEENWDTWGEDNVIEDSTNVEDYFESASKIDEFLKDSNFRKSPKASESLVQGSDKTLQTNIDDLVRNVQELDILKFKQPAKAKVKEEVDYFAEMIPVIAKRKSSLEQFQDDLETSKQV